jgi:UDP-glucose 4-epimerase
MIAPELGEHFRSRRVVITGGLGFIGSNLAIELVAAGADVLLLDALVPEHGGNRFNIAPVERSVAVDIVDLRELARLRPHLRGCDVLFNLAGQTSHLDSMRDPFTDLEHNCRAPLAALEACRLESPEARVVFAGTRQIYGRPHYLPVDERHPIDPVDVNGVNKIAGEQYHLLYGNVYGIPISVLRLTNTYGPRMRVRDARQTFLGVWLRAVARGESFQVWGDGTQLRDFTYVDDAVRAFLLAASRPEAVGEIFNVGGDPTTLEEVARLLTEIEPSARYELVPFPADRRAIDVGHYYADWTKIRERLGWEPRVDLRDGLERSLAYYREHGDVYWAVAA